MARTRTATQILTAARERADMDQPGTGPAFVDDTEGLERVNTSLGALWDMLAEAGGEHLLTTLQQQVSVVQPDWPADMLQLLAIEVRDKGGTQWHPMERIDARDLHSAQATDERPTHYGFADILEASPAVTVYPPRLGGTTYDYRIFYVPDPISITTGSDNVTLPNRWHQWVELDVAIDMLAKEESDVSALAAKQTKVEAAILKVASRMDVYRSSKVRDARGVTRGGRVGYMERYRHLYDRWGR